jgi:hypothetical protein
LLAAVSWLTCPSLSFRWGVTITYLFSITDLFVSPILNRVWVLLLYLLVFSVLTSFYLYTTVIILQTKLVCCQCMGILQFNLSFTNAPSATPLYIWGWYKPHNDWYISALYLSHFWHL